jgi:DNA-binding IscR family transcriptional regulator
VFLIKSPREVTLGQIIRLLDGPLAPIACVSQTAYQKCQDCPHAATTTCPIQRIMLDVRNAIASVLDHYTLEDFVFPQQGGAVLNMQTQPVPGATQKKKKSSDSQS